MGVLDAVVAKMSTTASCAGLAVQACFVEHAQLRASREAPWDEGQPNTSVWIAWPYPPRTVPRRRDQHPTGAHDHDDALPIRGSSSSAKGRLATMLWRLVSTVSRLGNTRRSISSKVGAVGYAAVQRGLPRSWRMITTIAAALGLGVVAGACGGFCAVLAISSLADIVQRISNGRLTIFPTLPSLNGDDRKTKAS